MGALRVIAGSITALALLIASAHSDPMLPTPPPGATSASSTAQVLNVTDYGAKCDGAPAGASGSITTGTTLFSEADGGIVFSAGDVGKAMLITGAGANGNNLRTTISSFVSSSSVNVAATAGATTSPSRLYASQGAVATAGASGSYAPGDVLTLTGGTAAINTSLTVATTQVYGTPTVAAAGSGGTNGTFDAIGTTGTGQRVVVNITVAAGAVSAINSVTRAGIYSANPTSLSAEPIAAVTAGFTIPSGAQIAVTMGVLKVNIANQGNYTAAPSNPVSVGSTTGSGTGATFTMTYLNAGAYTYGTDDTVAINSTTTVARALSTSHGAQPFNIVFPSIQRCLALGPLNFTGFSVAGTTVTGGYIECAQAGGVCVDALGSRFLRFEYLYIHGLQGSEPSIGLQHGRTSQAGAADFLYFNRVIINGNFTFAPLINFGSEATVYEDIYVYNRATYASIYGVVMDAYNHFNYSSTFVTETSPVDTQVSMNAVTFYGGQIHDQATDAGSAPVWAGGTSQLTFDKTYLAGFGPWCVMLWNISATVNNDAKFDSHCETSSVTDVFFVTGSASTPVMNGFFHHDDKAEETNSVIKLDSNVRSATITDADIQVTGFFPSNGVKLLDNPALWTLGGTVKVPTIASWNEPPNFTGAVCVGISCQNYIPTLPINRNPDFVLDQVQEGTSLSTAGSVTVVDGWSTKNTGSPGTLSFQRSSSSPPAGYGYYLATAVTAAVTPTAAISQVLRTTVEGTDMVQALFGGSTAKSLTFDFCAQANNLGTYAAFLQNGAANRSYIVPFTITIANVWQCFNNTIPGDTTGTWVNTQNHIGLLAGFTIGAGSNFNTTAGAWQTGTFYNTASTFNYMGTASATLNITAVHIGIGPYHLPYQPRPFDRELLLAQHWYTKSFPLGVKPAQNLTANGAVTFTSPFAQATSTVAGTYVAFPVEMYQNNGTTAPTMTFFSTSAASANCYDFSRTADAGAAAAVNTGSKGVGLQCTLAVGDLLGDQLQVQYVANSGF